MTSLIWFQSENRGNREKIILGLRSSEEVHHPNFTPPYFYRFVSVAGSTKHQRAPIETSIRSVAISVIPLSYHLLILSPDAPALSASEQLQLNNKRAYVRVCERMWACVDLRVELIQSNKRLLHPIFAKFLFYLASISLRAFRTSAHHRVSVCVRAHGLAFWGWCIEPITVWRLIHHFYCSGSALTLFIFSCVAQSFLSSPF